MHSLTSLKWNLNDQAEICDVLTIHPYPLFTPYCALDSLVSPRSILHSPAELSMYSDMTGKTCLVEEIGSLSSIMGGEKVVSEFVRANLFNAWAYNGLGLLWWTGFDQLHLTRAPYDWVDCERELGLFRGDGSQKLAAKQFVEFKNIIDQIPCLPERNRDAVCLVYAGDWNRTFGAFMLAKRAGLELKFNAKDFDNEIDDAKLYFMPGIECASFIRTRKAKKIFERIKAGATLVLTYEGGFLSPFESLVGCESMGRVSSCEMKISLEGEALSISREFMLRLQPITAEVLAYDENGNPAITINNYGKGKVIFVNAPVETFFATTANIASERVGYEKIYALARKIAGIELPLEKSNPLVNFTVHSLDEKRSLVVVINNTEDLQFDKFILNDVSIGKVYYGNIDEETAQIKVDPADGLIFEIIKK